MTIYLFLFHMIFFYVFDFIFVQFRFYLNDIFNYTTEYKKKQSFLFHFHGFFFRFPVLFLFLLFSFWFCYFFLNGWVRIVITIRTTIDIYTSSQLIVIVNRCCFIKIDVLFLVNLLLCQKQKQKIQNLA